MQIRVKEKLKTVCAEIGIALIFLCLTRIVRIPVIFKCRWTNEIFWRAESIFSKLCIALIFLRFWRQIGEFKYHYILLIVYCLGLSAFARSDNLSMYEYRIRSFLSVGAYVALQCRTKESAVRFIQAIAWLFFVLVGINLILILIDINLLGQYQYFIGIKNQLAHPLCVGLLMVYLNKRFNKQGVLFYVYLGMFFLTIFRVFSANNVIGALILAVYFAFVPLQKYLKKHRLHVFFGIYAFTFVFLVLTGGELLAKIPFVKVFVEDVLGKDLTFTGRTFIWKAAVQKFLERPLCGFGYGGEANAFYIVNTGRPGFEGMYSAHNEWLQNLYMSGILGTLPIVLLLFVTDGVLHKVKNKEVAGIFRIVIIAMLVMLMAEAPGWNSLLFVLYFGIVLGGTLLKSEANEKVVYPSLYKR